MKSCVSTHISNVTPTIRFIFIVISQAEIYTGAWNVPYHCLSALETISREHFDICIGSLPLLIESGEEIFISY